MYNTIQVTLYFPEQKIKNERKNKSFNADLTLKFCLLTDCPAVLNGVIIKKKTC